MFWERFRALCTEAGKTPNAVARELGLSSATTSQWKRRGSSPSAKTLAKLSAYFGVSADDLISEENVPLVTREKGTKIGVLSSVGAGIPLEAIDVFDQDDPEAWEEISSDLAKGGEFFALRIKGDSMLPRIRRGDVVIVRKQETVEEGDCAIVLVNGNEGVCKRVHYRDDGIALLSNNEEYPPLVFTKQQIRDMPVRIVGKVEEIRGKP